MNLTPSLLRMGRRPRPALVNVCPVCGRPVTEGDERSRLRGGTYVHRACGTYRVRTLGAMGGYRTRPTAARLPQDATE